MSALQHDLPADCIVESAATPGRRAIDDPMARRSIRRRRRIVWLLAAAAVLSLPTVLGTLVFGGAAVISAAHLHRVRLVLRDHPWRAVVVEGDSPVFRVVSRDHGGAGFRHLQFRSPRRFAGEAAGPIGATAGRGAYSVVRDGGSDQIHLVRGCVGNEVHHPAAPVEDVSRALPTELLPIVPCVLSPAGLVSCRDDATWLTVLATKHHLWRAEGDLLGRIMRNDLDFALVDRTDDLVVGRDRRFWDDVYWFENGERGSGRGRIIRLTNATLRGTGRRWPALWSDDGTRVALTSPTPRHRWWNKSVAISVRTNLHPVDRAAVVLHLAIALGLAPPIATSTQ